MNRIPPFWRGMAIIALIAGVIVVLDQERSLTTASTLVRFGFYIAIVLSFPRRRRLDGRLRSTTIHLRQHLFQIASGPVQACPRRPRKRLPVG